MAQRTPANAQRLGHTELEREGHTYEFSLRRPFVRQFRSIWVDARTQSTNAPKSETMHACYLLGSSMKQPHALA